QDAGGLCVAGDFDRLMSSEHAASGKDVETLASSRRMHFSWQWCVASRALDQGCGLLLTPRQREAQHARIEGDMRLERPRGRGLPGHSAVDPRDALEDAGARHHLLLPRVVGRHSCHAASCNTARSSPLRPATPASTPTGLSWNKTAKNTQPARYDP